MTLTDYADAFVAGARWWAERERRELDYQRSRTEGIRRASRHGQAFPGHWGTWPADYEGRAFVDGAKWHEYSATGFTMWPADQDIAAEEAERRYPIEIPEDSAKRHELADTEENRRALAALRSKVTF